MVIGFAPFRIRRYVVRIVENDAAILHRLDVVLVAVLIKAEQHVSFIAGAQNFARTDADLENRRTAGNGGGNGHEGHDLLFTAASQAREEAADGLDTVL